MSLGILGIDSATGLALEGLVDDDVTIIVLSSVDIDRVPDDGGVVVTITGQFEVDTDYNVFMRGAEDIRCYGGKGEKYTTRSTDGVTLSFVAMKAEEGVYDVEVVGDGGAAGSGVTLADGLTVVHRTYTTSLYSLRSQIGDPRDPGPRTVEQEEWDSSFEPYHPLRALISAIADTIAEANGYLQTRATAAFAAGDATLDVESTDRWGDLLDPWNAEAQGKNITEHVGKLILKGQNDHQVTYFRVEAADAAAATVAPGGAITGTVTVYGVDENGDPIAEDLTFSASSTPQATTTTWTALHGIACDFDNDNEIDLTDGSSTVYYRILPGERMSGVYRFYGESLRALGKLVFRSPIGYVYEDVGGVVNLFEGSGGVPAATLVGDLANDTNGLTGVDDSNYLVATPPNIGSGEYHHYLIRMKANIPTRKNYLVSKSAAGSGGISIYVDETGGFMRVNVYIYNTSGVQVGPGRTRIMTSTPAGAEIWLMVTIRENSDPGLGGARIQSFNASTGVEIEDSLTYGGSKPTAGDFNADLWLGRGLTGGEDASEVEGTGLQWAVFVSPDQMTEAEVADFIATGDDNGGEDYWWYGTKLNETYSDLLVFGKSEASGAAVAEQVDLIVGQVSSVRSYREIDAIAMGYIQPEDITINIYGWDPAAVAYIESTASADTSQDVRLYGFTGAYPNFTAATEVETLDGANEVAFGTDFTLIGAAEVDAYTIGEITVRSRRDAIAQTAISKPSAQFAARIQHASIGDMIGASFTFTGWFKLDSYDSGGIASILRCYDSTPRGFVIRFNGSDIELVLADGGSDAVIQQGFGGSLAGAGWVFVWARYDAVSKLAEIGYGNPLVGAQNDSATLTTGYNSSRPSTNLEFLANTVDVDEDFIGDVADVRWYTEVLTDAEINSIRNGLGVDDTEPVIRLIGSGAAGVTLSSVLDLGSWRTDWSVLTISPTDDLTFETIAGTNAPALVWRQQDWSVIAFEWDGSSVLSQGIVYLDDGGFTQQGAVSVAQSATHLSTRSALIVGLDEAEALQAEAIAMSGVVPVSGSETDWSRVTAIVTGMIDFNRFIYLEGSVPGDPGRFAAPGGIGTYTGLTATSLTGVSAAFDIDPGDVIVNLNRDFSGLDKVRSAFFIATADDDALQVIGRINGVVKDRGLDQETYRELLSVLIHGPLTSSYAVELVLTALWGEGAFEFWEDPAHPAVLFVRIPVAEATDTAGKSYLIGSEPSTLPTDGTSILTVLHEPALCYGIYAASDVNRTGTNYALSALSLASPQDNILIDPATTYDESYIGAPVRTTDTHGNVFAGLLEGFVGPGGYEIATKLLRDGVILDTWPDEITVSDPVFAEWMAGNVAVVISGSGVGNNGTWLIDEVHSSTRVSLVGAAFATELNVNWKLVPVWSVSDGPILLEVLDTTIDAAAKTITAPVPLRKGFFGWNFVDSDNEFDDHVVEFTGDPVSLNGAITGCTALNYGYQPNMDASYSAARTWIFKYIADVDGGTDTTMLLRGADDGSGDDGISVFVDWSSASALRVRMRDVSGSNIVSVNHSWKPTVGTFYWIMVVFDAGGSGDCWVRVYEDGNATPVYSSSTASISGTQSWTSGTRIGVDQSGNNPFNNGRMRDIRFYQGAVSDANGGKIADGTGYTTGLIWQALPSEVAKSLSTFTRGEYLVDYTTNREDAQARPDLAIDDGYHSPLWIYDYSYLTTQVLNRVLAAGIEPRVASE